MHPTDSDNAGQDRPLPIGPAIDTRIAERPGPVVLTGRFGRVEKLDPSTHGAALWRAMKGHDDLWTYSSQGPFHDVAAFSAWISARAELADPYYYAIIGNTGPVGVITLMEIRPAMRVLEVGHIVLSPALQRTPLATEAQYLLANYVFEALGYRRYEWKCDALNAASRRAAVRLGFTFEGIFRQHMIVKGRSRDTAWFSMLDGEWGARKETFERWLAPENFDTLGQQIARLAALNGAATARP
jgi:RimJ/RimL family protein N-acetyltransferase